MNPMEQIKNSIVKGIQPKGLVMNMINKRNPMASKLIDMAEKGDNQGLETFARNLLKERNLNFDEEMKNFKNKLGIN